jgi:hypothetical protein
VRRVLAAIIVLVGVLSAARAQADVTLTIDNGRVTLVAKDATIAQILAEWARVGQTKIVNGERLTGPPVTIELTGVPEETALGILLRSASGYLAAPKTDAVANTSRFNRILIMPTSSAPRPAPPTPSAPPPTFPQPQFPQPQVPQPSFGQPPSPDDPQSEQEPVQQLGPAPNQRGPVFQTFPMPANGQQPTLQPQPLQQNVPALAPVPNAPAPNAPIGVATPGMPVPVPTPQQGQPAPQQPAPEQGRRPGF